MKMASKCPRKGLSKNVNRRGRNRIRDAPECMGNNDIGKQLEHLTLKLADNLKVIPHQVFNKSNESDNKVNKLQKIWESYRDCEPGYFNSNIQFRNLLTFAYLMAERIEDAINENDEGTKKDPDNIMVLLNKLHIQKHRQQCIEALKTAEQVEVQVQNKLAVATFKAEVAYIYVQYGLSYYKQATKLYMDVLEYLIGKKYPEPIQHLLAQTELDTKYLYSVWEENESSRAATVMWCFHIASLFSKLLGKGNIHILYSIYGDNCDIDKIFQNICNIFNFVIDTGDETYGGRAWAEMADAFKMYELIGNKEKRSRRLPFNMNFDECMVKAVEVSPSSSHVLQLVGRHFRQRASNIEQFEEAKKLLEKCVKINNCMHVAHHHLGLANRAMWIIACKYDESKLYTNTQRKRKGKRKGNDHAQQVSPPSGSAYSNLAKAVGAMKCSDSSVSEPVIPQHPSPHKHRYGQNNSNAGSSVPAVDLSQGKPNLEPFNVFHNFGPTLFPTYSSTDGARLPRHFRKPDYFDTLRTSNPRQNENHPYLEASIFHLEEACRITNDTSPRYIIDLARAYISKNKTNVDIDGTFSKAKNPLQKDPQNSNMDSSYLYEQWGLWKMECGDTENALVCFRDSLKHAVRGKQRSRMAFYKLRDILKEKTEGGESNMDLVKENIFIHTLLDMYEEARDIIRKKFKIQKKGPDCHKTLCQEVDIMKEVLVENEDNRHLLWDLVDLFYKDGRPDIALQYLMIFVVYFPPDEEKCIIARNVILQANPHQTEFCQVFRWLFNAPYENNDDNEHDELEQEANGEDVDECPDNSGQVSPEDDSDECCDDLPMYLDQEYDILMLTANVDDSLIENITTGLKDNCGLQAFQACCCGDDDLVIFDGLTVLDKFVDLCNHLDEFRVVLIDIDGFKDQTFNCCFDIVCKNISQSTICFSRKEFPTPEHAHKINVLKSHELLSLDQENLGPKQLADKVISHLPMCSYNY